MMTEEGMGLCHKRKSVGEKEGREARPKRMLCGKRRKKRKNESAVYWGDGKKRAKRNKGIERTKRRTGKDRTKKTRCLR